MPLNVPRNSRLVSILCHSCYGAEQENELLEHYEKEEKVISKQAAISSTSTNGLLTAADIANVEISKPTNFKRGIHIAIDEEQGVLKGELCYICSMYTSCWNS